MANAVQAAWRRRAADILAVCLVAGVMARHTVHRPPPPLAPAPRTEPAATPSRPAENQQREQIARLIGQGLRLYWRQGGSILIVYSPHFDPGSLTPCQESWRSGLAEGLEDPTLTVIAHDPIRSYQTPSLSGPKPLVVEEFNRSLRKYVLDPPLAVVSFAGLPADDVTQLAVYGLDCPPFVGAYFPNEYDRAVVESLLRTGYLHAAVVKDGDELKLLVPPSAQR